jgi:hypothetical protein
LDIHKERDLDRSGGEVDYLGEIASRWRFVMRRDRAATAFIANSQASAIGATWWRRR